MRTKKNHKIILFDFDGVIADTFEMAFAFHKKLDIPMTKKQYRDQFMGNIYDAVEKKIEKTKHDEHFKMWFDLYNAEILDQPIHNGMKHAIETLAEKYILILVSSSTTNPIQSYLERHYLTEYFDKIFGADIHFSKVEKMIMIFKQYNVNANDCIFITDTVGDLIEAQKVGVESIVVTWGFHKQKRFKNKKPYKFVNSSTKLITAIDNFFDNQ